MAGRAYPLERTRNKAKVTKVSNKIKIYIKKEND